MKKKKMKNITKEMVIHALETEPLGWGNWCSVPSLWEKDCVYCALGGLINSQTDDTVNISRLAEGLTTHHGNLNGTSWRNATEDVPLYDEDDRTLPKNWPTAISFFWESLLGENLSISVEEARDIMIEWCEDTMPEDEVLFQLDIRSWT